MRERKREEEKGERERRRRGREKKKNFNPEDAHVFFCSPQLSPPVKIGGVRFRGLLLCITRQRKGGGKKKMSLEEA